MSVNYTVSLRLNEDENKLIRSYAEIKGMSVSEFLREAALKEIQDELDLHTFNETYEKYLNKPKVLSGHELRKKLGL